MKWVMLHLATQIKWLLGRGAYRPTRLLWSNSGIEGIFAFIYLLIVLLIPGGILVGAYWWFHQNRGANLQLPAREANLGGER